MLFSEEHKKGGIMKRILRTLLIVTVLFSFGGCTSFQESLFEFSMSAERHRSHMIVKKADIGDQEISYLEREGKGETIVLLHGFGADKDNWIRFARQMPEDYRIVAIDLLGHGDNSRDFNKTYDLDYITEGFTRTVETLNLDRFHLAGNSMGGYVSKIYAVQNPQKVITLGLFDSAGLVSPTPSDLQAALDRGENPLIVNSREDFDRLMKFAFYKEPFLPWPLRSVVARKYISYGPFNLKMWNDIWAERKEATDLLPRLHMPVFLIWGDRDRILHVSSVEIYQRSIPQIETVILKNCGHAPMIERPKETADFYVTFLDKNG
jgi:abhydrolase domain-containing protein 6